jgi:hypothetical protein
MSEKSTIKFNSKGRLQKMAKKTEATETTEATEATRAARGSSLEARAKRGFLTLLDAFNKGEAILQDTLDEFNELAKKIGTSAVRVGVPVEQRLADAQAEVAAIYENIPVENGKAVWTQETMDKLEDLNARIKRYKSEVDRKNKPEVSDAETDEAAE